MDDQCTMTPPQEAYRRLSQLEVKPSTLRLLLTLLSRADSTGKVTISHSELGKMLDINKRTVYSAMKELLNKKFLNDISGTSGTTNTYQVHLKIVNTCLLSLTTHEDNDKRDDAWATTETHHCTIETTSDTLNLSTTPQDLSVTPQDLLIRTRSETLDLLITNGSGTPDLFVTNDSGTLDLLIKNGPADRAYIEIYNTNTRVKDKDPEKEKIQKRGNSGSDPIHDQVVDHLGGGSLDHPPPINHLRFRTSVTEDPPPMTKPNTL